MSPTCQHVPTLPSLVTWLQEEEALERAQRSGEEAARRSSIHMTEEWMALVNSSEWRQLAHRYPDVMRELAAVAGGDGTQPARASGVGGQVRGREQMAA
jgi:hypothetical protein